jgi:hypothetical protein
MQSNKFSSKKPPLHPNIPTGLVNKENKNTNFLKKTKKYTNLFNFFNN